MRRALSLLLSGLLLALAACAGRPPIDHAMLPDYARPLPPGSSALRRLRPGDPVPDPATAFAHRDEGLLRAIEQSLLWFEAPSSRRHFPFHDVTTHAQAKASLIAFRDLLTTCESPEEFREAVFRDFEIWQTVGWNGAGEVLFTGYYAPEFPASRTKTERFRFPLYRRPADLATDPATGAPQGRRRADGSIAPWPARREIEERGMLAGTELVWLEDALSAYLIHVNGSARLHLPDGETLHVGYAGKTDRPYRGLGSALVREGLVDPNRLGLPAVRAAYEANPERVRELMYENESFVFFTEYDGASWPSGSLGVPVTAKASIATDKSIYPRGGVVLVATQAATPSSGRVQHLRFLLDQDTGGAIQAPGRADLFMGVGPEAEVLAGGQYAEGTLYYFFLRPDRVAEVLAP